MKLKRGELVEVWWNDTESDGGWHDAGELENMATPAVKTTGYYFGCKRVRGKSKHIILNHSIDIDNNRMDYTIIPYGCVTKIEKI